MALNGSIKYAAFFAAHRRHLAVESHVGGNLGNTGSILFWLNK